MEKKVYKLAIETGIGGGTVSVINDGKILDYRVCRHPANKADFLLGEIDELLKKNGIEKTQINEIINSDCPGSRTGLKIGASMANGLRLALNAAKTTANLFDGIFYRYSTGGAEKILIVLPSGGTDFVWRIYDPAGKITGSGQSGLEDNLIDYKNLYESGITKILLPLELFDEPDRIYQKFCITEQKTEVVDLGENLSGYLA